MHPIMIWRTRFPSNWAILDSTTLLSKSDVAKAVLYIFVKMVKNGIDESICPFFNIWIYNPSCIARGIVMTVICVVGNFEDMIR